MRMLLILATLALSGCRSSLTAPVSVPDAEVATTPQMAPRGQEEWPTRSVELKHVKTALVEAHWFVHGTELRGTDWYPIMVPASGPAIEFKADFDLHGWELGQFPTVRYGGNYQWYLVIKIDADSGVDEFYNDYHVSFNHGNNFDAPMVSVQHWVNGVCVSDLYHYADITMHGADLDSLKGRGGVRFTLPLSDFNLTKGPVRWMLFTTDDFWFPIEYHTGVTGDGVNEPPVSGWRSAR